MWRLLAGLLHLCEAASAGADAGADADGSERWRRDALRTAAALLGLDEGALSSSLGGAKQGERLRAPLCSTVLAALVDWLVAQINRSLDVPPQDEAAAAERDLAAAVVATAAAARTAAAAGTDGGGGTSAAAAAAAEAAAAAASEEAAAAAAEPAPPANPWLAQMRKGTTVGRRMSAGQAGAAAGSQLRREGAEWAEGAEGVEGVDTRPSVAAGSRAVAGAAGG